MQMCSFFACLQTSLRFPALPYVLPDSQNNREIAFLRAGKMQFGGRFHDVCAAIFDAGCLGFGMRSLEGQAKDRFGETFFVRFGPGTFCGYRLI